MTTWQDYLEQAERDRLFAIKRERGSLNKEYRLIYDRCRKRMERHNVS